MTRGFLLVDLQMNTVIVPYSDPDMAEWMRTKIDASNAHTHKTLKELDQDIHKYLKKEYEG